MATPQSLATEVVRELISTPNGQARLIGTIMCLGPAYYILPAPDTARMFAYIMLGLGFSMIMVSLIMATVASKYAEQSDQRVRQRDPFPASARIMKFSKNILSSPKTKAQLATDCMFEDYFNMNKEQLLTLLMQETAAVCVLAGVANHREGIYTDNDSTDQTVLMKGGDGA